MNPEKVLKKSNIKEPESDRENTGSWGLADGHRPGDGQLLPLPTAYWNPNSRLSQATS